MEAIQIRERPILFSTPMVQAILEGRKTMTRRIINPQPVFTQMHTYKGKVIYDGEACQWFWKNHHLGDVCCNIGSMQKSLAKLCPKGEAGDSLWVRETWQWDWKNIHERTEKYYLYKADINNAFDKFLASGEKWKPCIHMPKEACRQRLLINADIKVERLQDISEEDAIKEGVWLDKSVIPAGYTVYGMPHWKSAKECFQVFWEGLNGEESWKSNPWVWVVSFEKISI